MAAHSTVCCSDSDMMFPLGYVEGISFSVDLQCLAANCPDIVREAGVDPAKLQGIFCTVSASPELDRIFASLYSVRSQVLYPYPKLNGI